jgi:ATP-binding cassette, subfamily B, bacterial
MSESSGVSAQHISLFFWRHVWKYKWRVTGILFMIPASMLTLWFTPTLIVSYILQQVGSGHFVRGDLWVSFGWPLFWYALSSLLSGILLWRIAVFLVWSLEIRVLRDLAREVFDHYMQLSANFHANRFGGSLVSQANKLGGAYVRFIDTTVFNLYGLLLSFLFAAVILWPRVPVVSVLLVVFSLGFMALSVRVHKYVRYLNGKEASAQTKQTGYLADAVTNVLAVKSFAGGDYERERFADVTNQTAHATTKLMRASMKRDAFFASNTIMLGVACLTLAVAGVVLWDASIGTAFLIISYTGVITRNLWEFSQQTLRNYNRAFGDAQEMIEVLAIEPDVKDPPHPEPSRIKRGEIEFKATDFTHPDSREDETLFANLHLKVQSGEKIGLVGPSGSGKTTLTKLLLRFSNVDGGEILIDGQNITHISQDDLRRSIAYVPQEPLLFHRTIGENIAYGNPHASEKMIIEAAKKAYAHEFIALLPNTYDTLVGERGVKLSGGQRQRIAIARAILKDAPILVLDEATSALDSESEKVIQSALWKLMEGRTAIVIAHRLSTIQKMDRIIVLDHGRIIEEGSHHALLKRGGTYAKLWKHQSGGFIKE